MWNSVIKTNEMNAQPLSIFTSVAGTAISWIYRRLRSSEAESELQDPNSTNSNNNVEVTIKSMERLLQCLKNQTSFRFDPSFSILDLTYSSIDSYKPIIKALNDDHCVRKIIVNKVLDSQDFVTCLTKHNTTVTTISLHAYCFDIDSTEAIVRILKANPWIRVLELTQQAANISMDGFKIFCNNMEHYNFEELIISSAILSAECYDILLDSLQTNNSIKSIKIEKETYLERNRLVKLYRILKSKKITEFWNWGELDLDYEEFKNVLQANYITKLTLQGRKNSALYFDNIAEELKNNTSITNLTVMTEPQVWNTFKDIIAENKSITRLNLSFNIQAEQFSSLNLGSNTRILDLTITRCSINLDKLLSKISQNTTLRRLALDVHSYRSIDPAGVHPLQTILTENKSLKELHLMHVQSISTIEALIEGLSTNKTLRKLVLHTHRFNYEIFSRLIEALKVNNTLVELSGVKIVDIGIYSAPINGKEADDFFLDLLKTNKTLRYIYGAEEYPYLEDKLQKNRQEQDQLINDTCLLIGMIVMKQPSFILPLELWMHVFEYISFDFSDIDFVTYFRAVIRNKRK